MPPTLTPDERLKKSNRNIEYKCSECGRDVGRDNLKAKRVQFKEMGMAGPIIQSRTVAWLCVVPQQDGSPSCLELDPAWKQPSRAAAPGNADTRLAEHLDTPEESDEGVQDNDDA